MHNIRLTAHLKERASLLKESKRSGRKVVGYLPGNYVPEELIYAAGAIPVCLVTGGDSIPVEASLSSIPQVFCPFSRAQIGESILKRDPYYNLVDMIICPITCQHLRKVAEIWEYREDIKIFKLGVPHQNQNDFELQYFIERLGVLQDKLQTLTGNEISDERLTGAIKIYNRMRWLLKQISLLRRAESPPLSSQDFFDLNHASYYADPVFIVDILEAIYKELSEKQENMKSEAPRLMLIGPNIACGDVKITKLVEEVSGNIVIEEVFEGIRNYWDNIDDNNDPIISLASGYLRKTVPPAFLRDSAKKRLDFDLKLISDFNVSGVLWYELICCDTYDIESYYFSQKLKEHNIPLLILESDYSTANAGQMKTRIETFIETVRGGRR
jgi:benzoyl-CoA reductase/2-hydroxyglutaryl-CoA dehydratase subunit BcrC/BadD/HgdB